MDTDLHTLLETVSYSEEGVPAFSIITHFPKKETWKIDGASVGEFWEGYCDLVSKYRCGQDSNPLANVVCSEEVKNECPLIVEFFLKFETLSEQIQPNFRPCSEKTLAVITACIQNVLSETYNMSDAAHEHICAVLVTDPCLETTNKGNFINVNIRFHFPYAIIPVSEQRKDFHNKLISKLRFSKFDFGRGMVGNIESNCQAIGNTLTMYGSSNKDSANKLKLCHLWQTLDLEDTEDAEDDESFPSSDIDELMFPTNHKNVFNDQFDITNIDSDDPEYFYPLYFSINYYTCTMVPKVKRQQSKVKNGKQDDIDSRNSWALINKLLPMVSSERYYNEYDWFSIGRACYQSAPEYSKDDGLDLWINATLEALGDDEPADFMVTEESVQDTCSCLYDTYCDSNITVKTIAWMAKEDSPEQYKNWNLEWINKAIINTMVEFRPADSDVAEIFYRKYWLDFAYESGNRKWFEYKEHHWVQIDDGISLTQKISDTPFLSHFRNSIVKLSRTSSSSTSSESGEADKADNTVKKITGLIDKLKSTGYKSNLVREVREKFWIPDFAKFLDTNFDLMGAKNGVMVAMKDDCKHREGRPEDYIQMRCPVGYNKNFTWDTPTVKELLAWLEKTYPDSELCRHFKKLAGSMIEGGNKDKIFPIFTGNGNNSKSMIIKLFEATFGPHVVKMPPSILTENPKNVSGNGATPVMARAKGARIAFVDEPEDDVPMHKGVIKRFTGGDTFFARMLNDNGGDIKASFVLILVCNTVPVIPNADAAIRNRTRVYPHLSKWVEKSAAPATEEEQHRQRLFPMDTHFDQRIPKLASAFLWVACQFFADYRREGLNDPEIVVRHTREYWDKNDTISHFTVDSLTIHKDDDGKPSRDHFMKALDVYTIYKRWYRKTFTTSKPPDFLPFKTELINKWGNMDGDGWHGLSESDRTSEPTTILGSGPRNDSRNDGRNDRRDVRPSSISKKGKEHPDIPDETPVIRRGGFTAPIDDRV